MKLLHTPKTALAYAESVDEEHPEGWLIEIGDEVEWLGEGSYGPATHQGSITAIQPRNKTVRVAYQDETDWTVKGEPKKKTATVPAASLTLIARAM